MVNSYEEGYLGFYNVLERMIEGNFDEWTIFLWNKIGRRLVCRNDSEVFKVNQRVVDEIFSNKYNTNRVLEAIDMCTLETEEIVLCQEYAMDYRSIIKNLKPVEKETLIEIDGEINKDIYIIIYKEEPDITIIKFWTSISYLF